MNTETRPEVYMSNSLDVLLARFKENITIRPEDPFRKTCIVVSDIHMKAFMQVELAKVSGCMWGQTIITLDDALKAAACQEVHLFGISSLTQEENELFFSLCDRARVIYYVLSFCMHFWSDIFSEKEAKALTKKMRENQAKALQPYLYDRSRLLANSCKKAKEFMRSLEERLYDFHEEYELKKWALDDPYYSQHVRLDAAIQIINVPRTLLDALQYDLLLLAKPDGIKEDGSVQIHKAPTLLREVEVLYQYIQEHPYTSIVVFAPDIEAYRPYIQSLFQHSCQIIGQKENALVELFLEILDMPNKRQDPKRLFQLFQAASFQKKCGIDAASLPILAACMQKFDLTRFKEQVIMSWITSGESGIEITSTDAEALGKCLSAIDKLSSDIQSLVAKKVRPNSEWQKLFIAILEAYFDPAGDFYLIKQALLAAHKQETGPISQEEAIRAFTAALDAVKAPQIASAPIVFASLGTVRTLPRDDVVFLGMNEGASFDRHLFIEALLTAKKRLYISYRSYAFEEGLFLEPVSIVQDILDTLEHKVTIHDHSLDSASEQPYEALSPPKIAFITEVKGLVPEVISIKELLQVAKYPIKTYLQHGLGLYLQEFKQIVRASEFEVLHQKILGPLRKKAFALSEEEVEALARNEYRFLPPALQGAACSLLADEVAELSENAKALKLQNRNPVELELSLTADRVIETAPNSWKVPAIRLEVQGKPVAVVGMLSHIYPEGIALFEKKSANAIYKVWPELLIINMLKDVLPLQPNILFLKDAKAQAVPLENSKERLDDYVAYAIECRKFPYCISGDMASKLLQHDTPQFSDYSARYDPYLEFFLSRAAPEELQQHWEASKKRLVSLFGDMNAL